MAYRDDLAAAHARIEALEAQLEVVGGEVDGAKSLFAHSSEFEDKIKLMQREVPHDRADVRAARRVDAHGPPQHAVADRIQPQHRSGTGLDERQGTVVRSPICLIQFNDSVEMRVSGVVKMVSAPRRQYRRREQHRAVPALRLPRLEIG